MDTEIACISVSDKGKGELSLEPGEMSAEKGEASAALLCSQILRTQVTGPELMMLVLTLLG